MGLAGVLLVGAALGLVVGLLGGGGGILAVPVLVYLAGLDPDSAITASLVIVAVAAVTGLATHSRMGTVHWRTGATLGGIGIVGAWLGAIASAAVPDEVLLATLAALLLIAAGSMLRPPGPPRTLRRPHPVVLVALSIGIGFVVGFVGVGGGFLTVPVLVIGLAYPIRDAIGTGLLVMTINALAALAIRLATGTGDVGIDLALPLAVAAAAGAVGGALLNRRIPPRRLQVGFGLLAVLMAVVTAAETAIR